MLFQLTSPKEESKIKEEIAQLMMFQLCSPEAKSETQLVMFQLCTPKAA